MAQMKWEEAPDVKKIAGKILSRGTFSHICGDFLYFFRGFGSSSKAIARIWSLPTPWQQALKIKPQYIIEVISHRFDKLNEEEKIKTIIHELMHIPKTFSGALVSHRGKHHRIDRKTVDKKYEDYLTRRK